MPREPKKPIEYINVHLLKADIKSADAAISKDKKPESIKATSAVLNGGSLYYQAPPPNPVGWQNFLRPAFGKGVDRFRSQHASAVLFFPAGGRMFAVTFGYGRSLLAESALEADFGLRTALNLCEPLTLRAVDYRTIEERTRIGRVQLSEEGSVNAFRMDMDTDLLRGLEARSNDQSVCERLGARWSSLTVGARVEIKELPTLAAKLLRSYGKRKLPPDFEWIDNVRRVTDPSLITDLDAELESRLDRDRHAGIRLAMPEMTGGVLGMDAKFFKPDGIDFDASVATYLNGRRLRASGGTLHAAKHNHHVVLVDPASGNERHSLSVYRCVVAEIVYQGRLYLLADGEWFALDRDFVTEVDAALGKIKVLRHGLPAWNAGEHEGPWNTRASKHWKDAALLDKSNITHGGRYSRIEPADLLTKGRVLAHVKRRDKNSSGLSHLFAQGTVSADLISRDRSFRKKVADELPKGHAALAQELKALNFDPRKWTVGYVLLGADKANPAGGLPFFSKVNLRKHADRLASMQYRVGLIGV